MANANDEAFTYRSRREVECISFLAGMLCQGYLANTGGFADRVAMVQEAELLYALVKERAGKGYKVVEG